MAPPTRSAPVALVVALLLASSGCGGSSTTVDQRTAVAGAPEAPNPGHPLSQAETRGLHLFVDHCGSCHTFEAAGTIGTIGPNLGDIAITHADVLRAIRIGGGPHSHGAGGRSGNMPP